MWIITAAIRKVPNTITGGMAFTRICRVMTAKRVSPTDIAASTKSLSFNFFTVPRTIRAKGAHHSSRKTMMRFVKLGPKTPTTARANKLDGNVDAISVHRIISASTIPPVYPAITPRGIPMSIIKTVVINAVARLVRMPKIRRDKIHLPNWSVPNGNCPQGFNNLLGRSTAYGLFGAKTCANMPRTSSTQIIPNAHNTDACLKRIRGKKQFFMSAYSIIILGSR
jgi:hypothetical protein